MPQEMMLEMKLNWENVKANRLRHDVNVDFEKSDFSQF